MHDDLSPAHESVGTATFVVHGPENKKSRVQLRTFKDMYVITLLQILYKMKKNKMIEEYEESAPTIGGQKVFPDLTYRKYKTQ